VQPLGTLGQPRPTRIAILGPDPSDARHERIYSRRRRVIDDQHFWLCPIQLCTNRRNRISLLFRGHKQRQRSELAADYQFPAPDFHSSIPLYRLSQAFFKTCCGPIFQVFLRP
jgi:hypothetical protein